MEPNTTANPSGSPGIRDVTPGADAPQPSTDSEFQRFSALTEKLVQVPKEAVKKRKKG